MLVFRSSEAMPVSVHEVTLSLGSNINPAYQLRQAVSALSCCLDKLRLSSVYESPAWGFDGDNFLNLVAIGNTPLSVGELNAQLKAIEAAQGRQRSQARFSDRTLDIDLLTYDDWVGEFDGVLLPRAEILEAAFVLAPLAELLPQARHPGTGMRYSHLWQSFDTDEQRLWPIDFSWANQGPATGSGHHRQPVSAR